MQKKLEFDRKHGLIDMNAAYDFMETRGVHNQQKHLEELYHVKYVAKESAAYYWICQNYPHIKDKYDGLIKQQKEF